jgi:glycosyltransferase involved in cell wall biosynthesis
LKKRAKILEAQKSGAAEQNKDLAQKLIAGIEIRRVRLPGRAGWPRSVAFNQAILKFCRRPDYRPDVVQIVSSLQPRSGPWLIWLRCMGIPVVYAYTIPVTLPTNPLRRTIRRWAWRHLFNSVNAIIVSSAVLRDMMLELGVKNRIDIIPNGVDLQRFRPAADDGERQALRASLGMSGHRKVIITVGAVHPRKGTDVLLEGWARLIKDHPDTELFLVGLRKDLSYPDLAEFRQKLETLITASGASDRVHFTGLVRNIEEYLRAADVFVFPSLREGMPNVVLEAMASGLAVILTPFIGLSEDFGKPGREYLLSDHDPGALSSSMAAVLNDRRLQTNLGQRARTWVEETMDFEKILDRYAAFYRGLAAKD